MDEDIRTAERLVALWGAGVALSIPLGDGVFARGLHLAADALPAPLVACLGIGGGENGTLDRIVGIAVERGILRLAYDEPWTIGVPLLSDGRASDAIAGMGLSQAAASEAARRVFEACCRSGRRAARVRDDAVDAGGSVAA